MYKHIFIYKAPIQRHPLLLCTSRGRARTPGVYQGPFTVEILTRPRLSQPMSHIKRTIPIQLKNYNCLGRRVNNKYNLLTPPGIYYEIQDPRPIL